MTPDPQLLITNPARRILVVSNDEMLLRTRKMILGTYFHTLGAGRFSEAKALISRFHFDLIVFCHSLPCEECRLLADQVRYLNPSTLVMAMSSVDNTAPKLWADVQLDADVGPYGLLKACASMLGFAVTNKVENYRPSVSRYE